MQSNYSRKVIVNNSQIPIIKEDNAFVVRDQLIAKFLANLGIKGNIMEIQAISNSADRRLSLIVQLQKNNGNQPGKVLIDIQDGAPTWEQFLDVTFDIGLDSDIKIIICDRKSSDDDSEPAGDVYVISNLAQINNQCGVKTYLLETRENFRIEKINRVDYEVHVSPEGSYRPIVNQKHPSKRQFEEAEFWVNYYLLLFGTGFSPIDISDITVDWTPGYDVKGKGMTSNATWTDEGLEMSLVSKSDQNVIDWIWKNKSEDIEKAYPGRPRKLVEEDGIPMKLSVKVLDTTMIEVIRSTPEDKGYFAEDVLKHERDFADLMEEILGGYEASASNSSMKREKSSSKESLSVN